MKKDGEVIFHRALDAGQRKPNSFEGIRDRFNVSIECDVFLLVDGTLAVIHEKDVHMSQEEIEAMTMKDLNNLRVKERESGVQGTPMPLLREYLFLALDRNDRLVIEIKASTPEQAQKNADAIVKEISSFLKDGLSTKGKTPSKNYMESALELHSFSVDRRLHSSAFQG